MTTTFARELAIAQQRLNANGVDAAREHREAIEAQSKQVAIEQQAYDQRLVEAVRKLQDRDLERQREKDKERESGRPTEPLAMWLVTAQANLIKRTAEQGRERGRDGR